MVKLIKKSKNLNAWYVFFKDVATNEVKKVFAFATAEEAVNFSLAH